MQHPNVRIMHGLKENMNSCMLVYKLIWQNFEVIPLKVHIDTFTGNIAIFTE